MTPPPRRRPRRHAPHGRPASASGRLHSLSGFLCTGFLILAATALRAQDSADIIPEWIGEPNSPEELLPATLTPGLGLRAIPKLKPPPKPEVNYHPLSRLISPYYDTLFASQAPPFIPTPDPATFRPATVYEPPLGLRPRVFRPGLFEIYPFIGIAQSYDSNVNLTPTNQIRDFYVTPRAGLEFQLGSPDSIYTPDYDTIFAMHGRYEGWGDIFFEHPELSAYNQKFELTGRIGRSAAIWRPFVYFSDITGSNLQLVELLNRTRRIRVTPGVWAEYQFTKRFSYRQSVNYYAFDHPDPLYINLQSWNTKHEITWLALHATRAILWGQYRYSNPDRGYSGSEFSFGPGWQGQPDPRIYTELYVGYGVLDMDGSVPGRTNMSGLRFNGYTTFDWGPRFRPTFRYDREYAYNELTPNDNYVSTLLQIRNEFFLGGNYYLTPYLGMALDEFETSHQVTIQWRPELELSYALPSVDEPNESRVFVKFGYQNSHNIKGEGEPIDQLRLSFGCNWKF